MSPPGAVPVAVLFAFANDRVAPERYLRNLPEEQRLLRAAMSSAVKAGLCEVIERPNATLDDVLGVLQDDSSRDRIAVFHFGGHAGSGALLLESSRGAPTAAYAPGLARLLGELRGLELVFLNGCSTRGQVQGLLQAGVPAVIATSQAIDDEAATTFAHRFYQSLAAGAAIRPAFARAEAAAQTDLGPRLVQGARLSSPRHDLEVPWDLYTPPGGEERPDRWSLPLAAQNPLFGLPPLPPLEFPPRPYRHLAAFTRDEATVFFGRSREIRELFAAVVEPEGAPIILLFGAAGAGKSSLLAAGLQPRLEASHEVAYLRRDATRGLTSTLLHGLAGVAGLAEAWPAGDARATVAASWRAREAAARRPLLLILDQVEEAWSRPLQGGFAEAAEFAAALHPLFGAPGDRPRGRLLLAFRKEWLAELLRLLDAAKLSCRRIEVAQLDEQGIADAVAGLPSSERMRRHYNLRVDAGLPALIASDLLADPEPTVAPALQIFLTRMWSRAVQSNPGAPSFTTTLYRDLKRGGLLLDDFVEDQIRELGQSSQELVGSGLLLDLLVFHTTPLGTAETRRASEIVERYGARPEVAELIEQCQRRYLLIAVDAAEQNLPSREGRSAPASPTSTNQQALHATRLSHDTLAPILRRRFESSDLPGQRALRILEQRNRGAEPGDAGPPLDAFDLAQVQAGQRGMRLRTPSEERLVAKSAKAVARRRRGRIVLQATGLLAVILILAATGVMARFQNEARDRASAAVAASLMRDHPTDAALVLLEIAAPDFTPLANDNLLRALAQPQEIARFSGKEVSRTMCSPDARRVVTLSFDRPNEATLWDAMTGVAIATLRGHSDKIEGVFFRADGGLLATASSDHTARIWDAASGRLVAVLGGHQATVWAVSFSRDGKRAATVSDGGSVLLWDTGTWRVVADLGGSQQPTAHPARFSPDGTRLLTISWDHQARLWDAATGRLAAAYPDVGDATFSPAGDRLATLSVGVKEGRFSTMVGRRAVIRDLASGRSTAIPIGKQLQIHALSFSPDGARLLTVDPFSLQLADATSGRPLVSLEHAISVQDQNGEAVFSPDGKRLLRLSRDDSPPQILSTETLRPMTTFNGHSDAVNDATFSRDGARILTSSADGTTRVCDAATGETLELLPAGHPESDLRASFSSDEKYIVTASGGGLSIWPSASKRPPYAPQILLSGQTGGVNFAAFNRDGSLVVTASSDGTARIWNAMTGATVRVLKGHRGDVFAASFSPNGRHVLTVAEDQTARIWDAETGASGPVIAGHQGRINTAFFSPDGARVVTASWDRTARIWSAATGRLIATLAGHREGVASARFSPDGTRVVTASLDHTARIWEAGTGRLLRSLSGHSGMVWDARFNLDGRRVVTVAQEDSARIWDVASGRTMLRVGDRPGVLSPDGRHLMTDSVNLFDAGISIQLWDVFAGRRTWSWPLGSWKAWLSPDGAFVATASDDGTLRLWNADTGLMIATLAGHGSPVTEVTFSPDSSRLVTAFSDHTARISAGITGGESLQRQVRARTHVCLGAAFRQATLGERSGDAEAQERACADCSRLFFARLDGGAQVHRDDSVAAWRDYRSCWAEHLPALTRWIRALR